MSDTVLNSKEDIKGLTVGSYVSVDMMVTDLKFGTSKRGTRYADCNLRRRDAVINAKIWDSVLVEQIEANSQLYAGTPCSIYGKVDEYMGTKQLSIESVDRLEEYDISDYVKGVDKDKVYDEFAGAVNTMMSQKGITLLMGIFKGENLKEDFKNFYAATYYHDNIPGGGMHHTLKVMKIVDLVIKLEGLEKYRDLLIIGAALHDIGKIKEMKNGVYQENTFISHRAFGMEMMFKYKKQIMQLMGEDFYYRLVSIIQGHHGEWGEPCNTVYAKIIHLADYLESSVCSMATRMNSGDYVSDTSGNYIKDEHGWKLFI